MWFSSFKQKKSLPFYKHLAFTVWQALGKDLINVNSVNPHTENLQRGWCFNFILQTEKLRHRGFSKLSKITQPVGFSRWYSGKESTHQCRRSKRHGFDPWVGKIPLRRKRQPTLVFVPEKSHGQAAWWPAVHRVTKTQTKRLRDWACTQRVGSTTEFIPKTSDSGACVRIQYTAVGMAKSRPFSMAEVHDQSLQHNCTVHHLCTHTPQSRWLNCFPHMACAVHLHMYRQYPLIPHRPLHPL